VRKPRFQALSDLSHRREEDARKRVGLAERARAEQVERIAALEAERLAAEPGGLALREVYAAFWRRMDGEIAAARGALAARERDLEAARAELIEAHREAATWDKLRERDALTIAAAGERRSAKELDDFGARRRQEG
jgi:flagellar export protein FliJ